MVFVALLLGLALGALIALLAARRRPSASPPDPLHDALARLDVKLGEIERERAHARGALDEQLRALGGQTRALTAALRQPHTRGRWGELQLRRVVELAGMMARCDFVEQASVHADDGGLLRPDLVVRLPGGKQVIVDAKAPLHAFLDAHEAQDETTRTAALAGARAAAARAHLPAVGEGLLGPVRAAPEFVVLFLPGEHFCSAALEADPSLLEDGVRQSVLVADADDADRAAAGGRLRLAAGARGGGRARGRRARPRPAPSPGDVR